MRFWLSVTRVATLAALSRLDLLADGLFAVNNRLCPGAEEQAPPY